MTCSKIYINKRMLAASLVTVFLIIIGSVEMEHFLDKKGNTRSSIIGTAMTTIGYGLLAVLVSVDETTHKLNSKYFVKRGLPVLFVGAMALASNKMNAKPGMIYSIGGFSLQSASWALLASMMTFSTDKHRTERLWLYYGGAVVINASTLGLFMNRKYNAISGNWDGPENVFGLGLPLLTGGWLAFAVGMSLC